ncbi:hypothetical protein CS022_21440 [Veronia nyctiphanis]|uniref:Uncharacterized protein n=1 Tax=Veronia nyctiphanis TaxID=1278244 RepID=A0A4V1LSC6_9GAMM|nr:hypothetical protein [Veronia nyctiphanis]RXJ71228.1 hypothetical protein CS022_21440 [Veronia nyctiphanis]
MKIECPECKTDNDVEHAELLTCKKCDESFSGISFSKRKWISAGALMFGSIVGYKGYDAIHADRYPFRVEYAIADACINSSKNRLRVSQYKDKQQVCLCAVEKTTESVPYSDYKENDNRFFRELLINARACG